MTQSKDYFTNYIKERSKNNRLAMDIVRMREKYERQIADLKNEIINPKVKFKTPSDLSAEDAVSRLDVMNQVLQCLCEVGSMTPATILGRSRDGDVIMIRHMYSFILRRHYHFTLTQIGRKLGRDHSSIIHAVNVFDSWKKTDRHANKLYQKALAMLQITEDGQSK
jgi:chromosomal replication initiation ATPase DnaA